MIGPGDDAAVVRPSPGHDLVLTTDTLIEERHFRSRWAGRDAIGAGLAAAIGTRLAAANLSDIAAMGARPRWALLSAGISSKAARLLVIQRAAAHALDREGATLVGGNLSRVSGPDFFTLTLIGEVERGRAWKRSGARPGNLLAVTGTPGLAGAFVRLMNARRKPHGLNLRRDPIAKAWLNPISRIAAARALARAGGVTAAIDLSDGLSGDLAHLCKASRVGALIAAEAFAGHAHLTHAAQLMSARRRSAPHSRQTAALDRLVEQLRFGPSDDYELLIAVHPSKREACARAAGSTGSPLAWIGTVTGNAGEIGLKRGDGRVVRLPGRGYDHFA